MCSQVGPLHFLLYIMLIRIGCVDMEPQVIQFHGCRLFHCVNNHNVIVHLPLTILGGLQLCRFFITVMNIMNIKCVWLTFRVCICLDLLGNINLFLKSFVINFSFSLEGSFGRLLISSSNQKGVIHCFLIDIFLVNDDIDNLHLYLYSSFVFFEKLFPHLLVDNFQIHRIFQKPRHLYFVTYICSKYLLSIVDLLYIFF